MNSKIITLIAVGITVLVYIIFTSRNYDPLSQENKEQIIGREKIKMEMIYSKDLIGLSLKGELFELYIYNTNLKNPPHTTPNIVEWQGKSLNESCKVSGWSKLLNNPENNEFDTMPTYALTMVDNNITKQFLEDIENNLCHYCYIKFHDMENYLFLYSETSNMICYIRNRS